MHSAHAEIAAFVAAYAASAGGESRAATDDTNTMRPRALDDLGEQREREPDGREVVDRITASTISGVEHLHRLALRDAGVVDEHVDAAELVGRRAARTRRARRGRPGRSSTRATRARARGSAPSTSSSWSARRAQMPTVAPRAANPSASAGADARRRAGHEHVLAVQVVRHGVTLASAPPCRSRPTPCCSPAASPSSPARRRGSARRSRPRSPGSAPTSRSATATPTGSARTVGGDRRRRPPRAHRAARRARRRRGARVDRAARPASTCSSTTRAAASTPRSST